MPIKNIVFDVGNVLITWNPKKLLQEIFPARDDIDTMLQKIYKDGFWIDLNAGKYTEEEAIKKHHSHLNFTQAELTELMLHTKKSLTVLQDSITLVERLHKAGYPLYVLTDNTIEIMQYLKQRYDFWRFFRGIVNSAEVGHLKPSPIIYQALLSNYKIKPEETVFFDDVLANVEGAKAMKMHAFQFTTAELCLQELENLQLIF